MSFTIVLRSNLSNSKYSFLVLFSSLKVCGYSLKEDILSIKVGPFLFRRVKKVASFLKSKSKIKSLFSKFPFSF